MSTVGLASIIFLPMHGLYTGYQTALNIYQDCRFVTSIENFPCTRKVLFQIHDQLQSSLTCTCALYITKSKDSNPQASSYPEHFYLRGVNDCAILPSYIGRPVTLAIRLQTFQSFKPYIPPSAPAYKRRKGISPTDKFQIPPLVTCPQ